MKADSVYKIETSLTTDQYRQFHVPANTILQAVKKANAIIAVIDPAAEVLKVDKLPLKLLDETVA